MYICLVIITITIFAAVLTDVSASASSIARGGGGGAAESKMVEGDVQSLAQLYQDEGRKDV